MASASIATVPYRPPLATGTPTTTQPTISYNYGTSTAQPGHTDVYLYYFIVPYLDAHVLSPPSWRYAYIVILDLHFRLLAIWTMAYQLKRYAALKRPIPQSPNPSRDPDHKPGWNFHPIRWTHGLLMRRLIPNSTTISARSNRANQIPRWYSSNISIGQAISLLTFTVVLLAISLVGDDYISPTTCTWGGRCPVQVFNQGPPRSTYAPLSRRARIQHSDIIPPPQPAHAPQLAHAPRDHKILLPRATALSLNPNGWAPFTDPLLSAPNVDVPRTMWTLSSRFGLIAYAMIPFVVSIGLKSWPFNIFAIPWLTHYGFDRTSILHRWTGRLIWVWSTIHTITFAIQLGRDINPYGNTLLTDVWQYYRFNWGVVAYIALTITVGFSFNPLRNRYYEFFYCSHVVLSILFLVGCIIHYEPLWAWAVIGLALWGAERAFRLSIWLWFNGFLISPTRFWSNQPPSASLKAYQDDPKSPVPPSGGLSNVQHSYPPPSWLPSSPGRTAFLPSSYEQGPLRVPPKSSLGSAQIPPGFALVQVLPGQTLRITHRMVKDCKWEIGQYLLLCVPSVSWWQTHPYTICSSSSLSQFDASSQQSSGKEVVLLLRARQGFSKKFYESIMRAKAERFQSDDSAQPTNGILMRCQISRPLGSSGRVGWDSLDSLVIVCGGSGISFGIAALEETCFKICTRSHAKANKGVSKSNITRVRLVWIFREYAHLIWVAPALKRCLAMVSSEELQLDLYVSNSLRQKKLPSALQGLPKPPPGTVLHNKAEVADSQTLLMPPHPPFSRLDSDSDFSPTPPRHSFTGSITVSESEQSHGLDSQDVPLDFTEFEGEARGGTIAEMMVSANVKDEGKRRRKNTISRNNKGGGGEGGRTKAKGIFGNRLNRAEASLSEEKNDDSQQITLVDGDGNKQVLPQQLEHSTDLHSSPWKDDLMREMGIDLSPHERLALEELSEGVKTGRPRLAKILDEEVDRSAGKTLIACCGPESLNGFMRSLVSQQYLRLVDRKISHKDIDIYTEDFSY
ncbi:uncharacterized protein PGTG_01643 [Puccinia graminis f. sp. tritici CRL 75-36-700-3]|uniref:FAD-binding FR-type domain-containing protein n=1 Tax=Puccinia graminis f. sp. tritici (strain CRL 75-36-700-3 / race SCCL) TaxID=418459 RepID=E3JSM5_PUCGT|nr:uncharacterized protein PGTG_01643 [Puccinia graminis f. sp. tritici CRL 75-36-700-3]EFP75050.2 hypothetical protein PGTG_01643 [Puccinia graminis f. sp. tritici CRL 75-36-700-3]